MSEESFYCENAKNCEIYKKVFGEDNIEKNNVIFGIAKGYGCEAFRAYGPSNKATNCAKLQELNKLEEIADKLNELLSKN